MPAPAPDPAASTFALHGSPTGGLSVADLGDGPAVPLTYDPAGLSAEQLERFPALEGYLALRVP